VILTEDTMIDISNKLGRYHFLCLWSILLVMGPYNHTKTYTECYISFRNPFLTKSIHRFLDDFCFLLFSFNLDHVLLNCREEVNQKQKRVQRGLSDNSDDESQSEP
jgi:hypothetical protein